MNVDLLAALLVERRAKIPPNEAVLIVRRNARFLPEQLTDDYYSIVLLELSELSPEELDARQLETICNRISKRLLYSAKTSSQRFVGIETLHHAPSVSPDDSLHVKEVVQQLPLEEQIYLVMRMEGYTLGEIATRFDLPLSTVHHTWKRIASKVEKLIADDVL